MVVWWMEGRYQRFCWCDEGVFEYGLRLMDGAGSVHIYSCGCGVVPRDLVGVNAGLCGFESGWEYC